MTTPLDVRALVETALDYLATNDEAAAAARAQRVRAEHERKRVRARLILASDEKTAGLREAWAEAHADYGAACEAEALAVEEDELHRNRRNKADAIIEFWRTQEATRRAGKDFR